MSFRAKTAQRGTCFYRLSNPHSPTSAQLQLLNSGTQTYDEFLSMLRWNPTERTSLVASYVRSRAFGELNDYNQFFGNNPYPLIRPNQYGPLPSDAPNRVLFWAIIGLPYKFQFVPILDVHTGFPYSKLDENWNYIGARDQAGRFPTFASLDLKIQYPFDFPFAAIASNFLAASKSSTLRIITIPATSNNISPLPTSATSTIP